MSRHTHSSGKIQARLIVPLTIALMLAGAAIDILFSHDSGHGSPCSLPGFWSVFGLLGCLLLAGACKLAARFLKRSEKYYDDIL
jgi:hypothetical protein